MNKTLLTLLVLGLSGAALAATEDRGFYFGTAVGQADADNAAEFGFRDDSHSAFRLYGGYEFSRYLAAEAGYLDFGTYKGTTPGVGGPATTRLELDGFSIGLRPQFEFGNQWFAQAQVGAFLWDSSSVIRTSLGTTRDNDNGERAYYGLGVGRNFGPTWRLSGEWTRYESKPADVDFLNLAMSYRFGR